MKINECAVIDNKVIDDMIAECENKSDNIFITESLSIFIEGQISILRHIKQQLNPLEPIVRDAYFKEDYLNELTPADFNDYINETEI